MTAPAGLAAGRGLAAAAPGDPGSARSGRDSGLVPRRGRLASVRAKRGGEHTGPSPTDRGKAGTKYHVLCDRNGLPLHALVSGANTHDSRMLTELLDTNPGVREHAERPGRLRRRPDKLHADKGYDYPRCRRYLHQRGIGVRIARRGIEDSNRLGRIRWVVNAAWPGYSAPGVSGCATNAPAPPLRRCYCWPVR